MYILDNPEFKRLVRTKLRRRGMISYASAAVLVFGGVLAFMIFIAQQMGMTPPALLMPKLFNSYFFWVVGIQLAMVSLHGVTLTAQNITLEKERGTFDFQRLVSMGPWPLTLGKMFGAPAEAFYMALFGIPFAVMACLGSDTVPPSVLFQSETIVFVYGLAVSSFGLMCSSIAEKTSQATGIVVLLGIPFYGILGAWNQSSLWATSSPIFMLGQFGMASYAFTRTTFQFYGVEMPIIAGFLMTNLLIMLVCLLVTSRRIADAELSYMTPRQGIVTFATLQLMLIGNSVGNTTVEAIRALQIFHAVNLTALLMLAFALTPGAELVRGRVFRAKRDEHWKIVMERTNRLQDSPALRVMLEICGIYLLTSALYTGLLKFPARETGMGYMAVLTTVMVAGLAVAMTGLLLYIQVYTERGYFKMGMAFLILGLIAPPMLMWIAALAIDSIKTESLLLISPVAYIVMLGEIKANGGELACPSICVVLAVSFCVLSAMRIRFLLDMEDLVRKRGPAPRGQTLAARGVEG